MQVKNLYSFAKTGHYNISAIIIYVFWSCV